MPHTLSRIWNAIIDRKSAGDPGAGVRMPMPASYSQGFTNWAGFNFNRQHGSLNFREIVGDATMNSAVAACLNWITTSWPMAPPCMMKPKVGDDGKITGGMEPVEHPMAQLLLRPSRFYSGKWLTAALLADWYYGDAFAYIVAPKVGKVPVELQYLPRRLMTPQGSRDELITHYDFRVDGRTIQIPAEDVLHYRFGMDPNDPKRGRGPLLAIDPEIATDNEATLWQYALLANGGVPSWVIGPDGNADGSGGVELTQGQADFIFAQMEEKNRPENRGQGLVMQTKFRLQQMGFDPNKMEVGGTQTKAEERICAAFGLPPIVAGLGAGLEHSTYSNTEQARQAAWEDCIIPAQDYFADELNAKLKTRYPDAEGLTLSFDRSGIRCLRDDRSSDVKDATLSYEKGVVDRATAKRMMGQAPTPDDEGVYYSDAKGSPLPEIPAKGNGAKTFVLSSGGGAVRLLPAVERKNTTSDAGLKDLYAAAREFRSQLLRHEADAVADIGDVLDAAEKGVRVALDALLAKIAERQDAGEPVSDAWLREETRFRDLLEQMDTARVQMAGDGAEVVAAAQGAYVQTATEAGAALAVAAAGPAPSGVTAPELTWNALPKAKLEALAGFMSDGSPLSDYLATVGKESKDALRAALINGVTQGKGADAIRRDVEAVLGGQRTRAANIARTEPMRAAREASRLSFEANSDVVTGWVWTSATDLRTCPSCWAMHGTVHAHGSILDDHVCGRCVAVPQVKSWAEITGDATLPDTRPVIESGADRFAKLSTEQQQAVLGPGLYGLYAAGSPLSDFVSQDSDTRWGTMRRVSTVAEATAAAAARGE